MTKKKRQKVLDALEEKIRLAKIAQSSEEAADALKRQSNAIKKQSDIASEELEFKKQTDNRVNLSLHDYEEMVKEMEFLRSQYENMRSIVETLLRGYIQRGVNPAKVIEELRKQDGPKINVEVIENHDFDSPFKTVKVAQILTIPEWLLDEWKL